MIRRGPLHGRVIHAVIISDSDVVYGSPCGSASERSRNQNAKIIKFERENLSAESGRGGGGGGGSERKKNEVILVVYLAHAYHSSTFNTHRKRFSARRARVESMNVLGSSAASGVETGSRRKRNPKTFIIELSDDCLHPARTESPIFLRPRAPIPYADRITFSSTRLDAARLLSPSLRLLLELFRV